MTQGQARIHTSFHCFMEIGPIFQKCLRNLGSGSERLKYYHREHRPRTPLEAFDFCTCFENRLSAPEGCLFMAFSPIPLSAPNSHFLQLLPAYNATVLFLGMFIFFFFHVCCDCFIAWISLIFYLMECAGRHDVSLHHKHIHRYKKGSLVWLNCTITSGSLGKQECYENKKS